MYKNQSEGLRPKILETTRALLIKTGIHGLTMRKIAGEIGCRAPSIYYYFKNKDALIHALIEEGHARLWEQLSDAQDEELQPLDQLETNIRVYLDFAEKNAEFYEIMYMLHVEDMNRYPREKYREARKALQLDKDLYGTCVNLNLVKPIDEEFDPGVGILALHGYAAMRIFNRIHKKADKQRLEEALIERLLRGLGVGGVPGARVPL